MFDNLFKMFINHQQESEYRQKYLVNVKRALYFSVSYFWINVVLVLFSDIYIIQYESLNESPVIFGRIIFITIVPVLGFISYKSANYKVVELTVFAIFLMITMTSTLAHLFNPDPKNITYAIELVVIISFYLIFPISLKLRLLGAVIYSASLSTSLSKGAIPDWFLIQIILLIITCNIIGFMIARYNNATARRLYLRIENTRIMRTELELTLNDIKIVKGIIPICASCKKIRDDSGFWDQLQSYFKRISNVDFINSTCPKCLNSGGKGE